METFNEAASAGTADKEMADNAAQIAIENWNLISGTSQNAPMKRRIDASFSVLGISIATISRSAFFSRFFAKTLASSQITSARS
jgi:hypothetical protein